ncbi:hypothetical protein M407DRAFT_242954 [Tulasnella calospora MUT 4182]|uniref:Uncharacterized protein n=1 Tax=Tulasnella calospora MUT 4182 TaxID=1051891 RepID=A0A0C3L495_9AGAM|nr:hypothetical protein M407DRAFT_242954 [Tulasnella calospora MUT 4182]
MGREGYDDVGFESAVLVQHHDLEEGVSKSFGGSSRENSDMIPTQREESYGMQRFEARKDTGTVTTMNSSL